MIGLLVRLRGRVARAAKPLPNPNDSGRAAYPVAPESRPARALSSQPCEWCAGTGCEPSAGNRLVECRECGGIGEVPFDDSEAP